MRLFGLFLKTALLSAPFISSSHAASNQKTSIDFQAMQQSIVQIVQANNADKSTTIDNKSSQDSKSAEVAKSLPTIVPPANKQATTSYHQRSNSYATNPDSDPPRYVRKLSEIGVERFNNINWLEVGLEHRTRYEWRNNDVRRIEGGEDNPIFLRNRAWIGIKEILDPFRFAVEFQGSRVVNNKHAITDQERNEYDLLNAYGEKGTGCR